MDDHTEMGKLFHLALLFESMQISIQVHIKIKIQRDPQ